MYTRALLPFVVMMLMSAFQLAGCGGGGGGGGSGDSSNTIANGSLTVTVTSTGGQAVNEANGEFYLETHSPAVLKCNVACTVSQSSNVGVTLSGVSNQSDGWSATLDFATASSVLELTVTTQDGSKVVVRLHPLVGTGGGTWSLNIHSWTRGSSTQNQSTSTAGPATAIAVNSTVFSNCKSSAYECSTVTVHWYGHTEGTFTIDPDFMTRLQYVSGTAWVNVKATGGTADDVISNCTPLFSVPNEHYYNTDYRPTTGTIRVTRGSDGKFRVTTDLPLTAYKQPDSENQSLCIRSVAAPDAPATASVTLNAIY